MQDFLTTKAKSGPHDEPLFESMRRISRLQVIPPLSDEQVARHMSDDATRGFTRSYRKFAAGCLAFTGILYVGEAGKAWPLPLAALAFLFVLIVFALAWRGVRAALVAGMMFILAGLVRNGSTLVSQMMTGGEARKDAWLMLGLFGFFLHVFAAALQIEHAKRRPENPVP